MAHANIPFDKRLKKIVRKREQLAHGSVKVLLSDGLIIERPRRLRAKFPFRTLGLVVVLGFLVKGLFVASIGAQDYNAHLALLDQGSLVARAGAWLLQGDAVTLFVADILGHVIV